jgi:P27 family predicted phage terminase small subunit
MGLRGPTPTPSAIKLQRGTYRADRAARNEAKATGKPTCPAWLSKDAKKEWRRVVKLLADLGLIGAADGNALTRYAVTWVRWRQAVQMIDKGGEVVVYRDEQNKPKSVQPSAFNSIARSLADELSRLEMQLGMNPAARSRIEVAPPAAAASEPKSRFFDPPGLRN